MACVTSASGVYNLGGGVCGMRKSGVKFHSCPVAAVLLPWTTAGDVLMERPQGRLRHGRAYGTVDGRRTTPEEGEGGIPPAMGLTGDGSGLRARRRGRGRRRRGRGSGGRLRADAATGPRGRIGEEGLEGHAGAAHGSRTAASCSRTRGRGTAPQGASPWRTRPRPRRGEGAGTAGANRGDGRGNRCRRTTPPGGGGGTSGGPPPRTRPRDGSGGSRRLRGCHRGDGRGTRLNGRGRGGKGKRKRKRGDASAAPVPAGKGGRSGIRCPGCGQRPVAGRRRLFLNNFPRAAWFSDTRPPPRFVSSILKTGAQGQS